MPRRSLEDLPLPPIQHRVDLAMSDFETLDSTICEQQRRCAMLDQGARMAIRRKNKKAAQKLAKSLKPSAARPHRRCSSPLYMRDIRIRAGGAIWELAAHSGDDVAAFHLLGADRRISIYELQRVCARALRRRLRSALDRAGAVTAEGWLICFLDGDHEPIGDTFDLHWHGIAAGGFIDVVRRLDKQRNYSGDRGVLIQQPIKSLPRAITYTKKRYWKSVPRPPGQKAGRPRRQTQPAHSISLLWLDRYQLSDLCLMYHVSVGKEGKLIVKSVHQ